MVLISKRHEWYDLPLSLSLSLSLRGIKYSCNYDGIINSRKKLQTVVATRPGKFVISYATPAKVIGRTGIKNELIYIYTHTYVIYSLCNIFFFLPPQTSPPLHHSFLFFFSLLVHFIFFDVPRFAMFRLACFPPTNYICPHCKLLGPIRAAIIMPRQKKYYVRDAKVC